jgi:hypothetical protein
MPLKRPHYYVEYDPTAEPLTVAVTTGDMMRAELEAKRLSLPPGANVNLTALWLWSALVRLGIEQRPAPEFMADPPEWDPVKDANGQPVMYAVDPTQAGAGTPASPSLPTTVTPDSGLTPS